jgi:hypothetical protein
MLGCFEAVLRLCFGSQGIQSQHCVRKTDMTDREVEANSRYSIG